MIPAKFDYLWPRSVDEAVAGLSRFGDDAKILSGGQSLIPILRLRLAYPSVLLDVSEIPEMRGVRDDGDAIVVGASTTHAEVINDPLLNAEVPLIPRTTRTVADRQVRHLGTFGGALAHADPAGDLAPAALALDAGFVLAGPSGRRTVPAADFFQDYLQTALAPDELLVEVRLPKLGPGWGMHYEKFQRVAQSWAIVGVAAAVRRSNGSIAEARIGLTNMGTTPVRASAAERALAGAAYEEGAVAAAAEAAAEGTDPPSDLNGHPDYRRHLARVLTRRAVLAAGARA